MAGKGKSKGREPAEASGAAPRATGSAPSWRNRIVRYSDEDPAKLAAHPQNFRLHGEIQTATMRGALHEIGVVQNVVVSIRTGRILDGHLRVGLAVKERQPKIPVTWVDLDPKEEAAVLASLDAIGSMAEPDPLQLGELISGLEVQDASLADLFQSMMHDAALTSLQDAGPDAEPEKKSARDCGDPKQVIRPVLYVDEIAIFERAIKATDENNRGKALMEICRVYLDSKRQLDV